MVKIKLERLSRRMLFTTGFLLYCSRTEDRQYP